MAQANRISAADAVKAFKGQAITVQTAKAVKVKGADDKTRDGWDVKNVQLAAEHVLAAYDYGERVVMTTIDGRKYECAGKGGAAA